MTDRTALDAALLRAHGAQNRDALIDLYAEAADDASEDEAAFFLTHAMVFALEAGDPRAEDIRARLVAMGREAPA